MAETILLLQDLWDELGATPEDIELTEAPRTELDRRLAAHRAAPADVLSWDEVRASVRDRG